MAAGDNNDIWQCKINRHDSFLSLVYSAPLWTAGGHATNSPVNPPAGIEKKSTTLIGHFFTAAISKFIEIDWFLQIIVKLILPLNMKLERGLDGRWPAPTSKQEAHGWL